MTRTHPGRPPLDEDDESVPVCVTMPSKQFERYRLRAAREDTSVPEIIRRDLREKPQARRIKI